MKFGGHVMQIGGVEMSDFYIGQKFNNFTVKSISSKRSKNGTMRKILHVVCDCGKEKEVRSYSASARKVTRCVCDNEGRYAITHGMYGTKIYTIYRSMLQRCYDKKSTSYPNYGGRGIRVSDEWLRSFDEFYKDMGDVKKGMSLDRVDSSFGYSKSNCRWASYSNQAHNKRALTGGFKGVSKRSNRYISRIMISGEPIHIGSFKNPLDAAVAYDVKASELRKENSMTNKKLGKLCGGKLIDALEFYKFSHPDDLYLKAVMQDEK